MNWMKKTKLGTRLLVALFGIPVIFLLTILGRLYFTLLVAIISLLALRELYLLSEKKGFSPIKWIGLSSIAGLCLDIYLSGGVYFPFIILFMVIATLLVELFKNHPQPLVNMAMTLFGLFYIGLLSFLILIRESNIEGFLSYTECGYLVISIFISIWICDTGAYFIGSSIGKISLFKRVSPNKTWEGALGGLATGILSMLALRFIVLKQLTVIDALVIGLIIGIPGQISDLIESKIKRDADVKDSSDILPGHGGFLDRFDSPILIAPFIYFYLVIKYSLFQ